MKIAMFAFQLLKCLQCPQAAISAMRDCILASYYYSDGNFLQNNELCQKKFYCSYKARA